MSTIKRAPRPQNFLIVSQEVARDVRLSYRARGVLIRLLSNADGYQMSSEQLAGEGMEGRDAIRKALRELSEAGYLVRLKVRGTRGQWITETTVYDQPVQQTSDDGFSGVGKPGARNPTPGTPTVGKPGGKSKESIEIPVAFSASRARAPRTSAAKKKQMSHVHGIACWTQQDIEVALALEHRHGSEKVCLATAVLARQGVEPLPSRVAKELNSTKGHQHGNYSISHTEAGWADAVLGFQRPAGSGLIIDQS